MVLIIHFGQGVGRLPVESESENEKTWYILGAEQGGGRKEGSKRADGCDWIGKSRTFQNC